MGKWMYRYIHSFASTIFGGGGEWLISRTGRFNPEKEPRDHLDRCLGGSRAGVGDVEK
jgi:hypothetical protein